MRIFTKLAAILAVGTLAPALALAGTLCPGFSGDPIVDPSGCNTIITVNSNGTLTITPVDNHPYENIEDQLVGVVNNSSLSVTSLTLDGGSNDIFGFDGDGIDGFVGASNSHDNTGYGGANAFFTAINSAATLGTVNFITPVGTGGGTSYFSLELAPTSGRFTGNVGGQVPEPSSLILLGSGVLGLAGTLRRRFVK